ncbi:GNAT family N-acetyltransferase [Chitinibacter fontanus]|uniref:GNAT family N-acetyltransferase n=1 Tax=Chitinibacter fontanus TaxID=1737446 RepID=A0A7D5V7Q6_9NEIS|nr:GNAT family N-acetyltransferase [Chitinibacter fontanus]QLI80336.1 GNAT family N-acetyltransferase [Chitinibacter fontanus]
MKITFCELKPDNLAPFCDLYLRVFNAAPWHDGWHIDAVCERFATFSQFPRFYGLGMLADDVPVGLAFGWGERWIEGWHFFIKEFCIDSQLQGQGLGKQLFAEYERRLHAQGYRWTFLNTARAVPAYHFYRKIGFLEEDQTILTKQLTSPAAMLA